MRWLWVVLAGWQWTGVWLAVVLVVVVGGGGWWLVVGGGRLSRWAPWVCSSFLLVVGDLRRSEDEYLQQGWRL